MGKHLSFEEKHNAENELAENKEKIKELRAEINRLKYRNDRLNYYLHNSKKSKHNGCYGENGVANTLFGKRVCDMTENERRRYITLMQRKYRQKSNEKNK